MYWLKKPEYTEKTFVLCIMSLDGPCFVCLCTVSRVSGWSMFCLSLFCIPCLWMVHVLFVFVLCLVSPDGPCFVCLCTVSRFSEWSMFWLLLRFSLTFSNNKNIEFQTVNYRNKGFATSFIGNHSRVCLSCLGLSLLQLSKNLELFSFPVVWFWMYLMKVISEMCRMRYIWYRRIYKIQILS